jgi:signal transduction histidine kinase
VASPGRSRVGPGEALEYSRRSTRTERNDARFGYVGRAHLLLLDAAVAVVVGGIVAVGVVVRADADTLGVALVLGLASAAVLVARRHAPVATFAVSGGLVLALFAVDHAAGSAAVLAPAAALFSLALTRGRTHLVVAGTVAVAAVAVVDTLLAGHATVRFSTFGHIALVAMPLLAAEALRNHRANVALLRERLELAERTREEEALGRVEQERLRIARDLHDVVAHTLTTINVQAGVAAHLLDREPGHVRAALGTIETASHDALEELRAIVGVLRTGETDAAPLERSPTIEAVDELVERARDDGLDVSLEIRGARPDRLPEAVQLAAYRIVQESLTNVRRHAHGAGARVELTFEDKRLLVTIQNGVGGNDGADGLGIGIIGMKERATAIGGAVRAGPSRLGFRVAAELPYRRRA